jgi:hypothetical protein
MRQENLIWTALPNGHPLDGDDQPDTTRLALSVFLSPRLSTDEVPGGTPLLSMFPDFVNWPSTIGGNAANPTLPPTGISFTVTIGTNLGIPATITNTYPTLWTRYPNAPSSAPQLYPNPNYWPLVFDPTATAVNEYQWTDYSKLPFHSFDEVSAEQDIASIYQTMGLNSPNTPPTMVGNESGLTIAGGGGPINNGVLQPIGNATGEGHTEDPIGAAVNYYNRPANDSGYTSALQTLDFHAGLSALASYPILLRYFGLAFDLVIDLSDIPGGFPDPGTQTVISGTVSVTPSWTSIDTNPSDLEILDVAPETEYMYFRPYGSAPESPPSWLPLPYAGIPTSLSVPPDGTFPDYINGMLNLADGSRFSVTDLDVDGAAQQVSMLSNVLTTVQSYQYALDTLGVGQSMALALPNLRSSGPAVVWSGWAASLIALTANQTTYQTALEKYIANPNPAVNPLPVFRAEDLIRGHRFDVYTAAGDYNTQAQEVQSWFSLVQRIGAYTLGDPTNGAASLAVQDEGVVSPGASQVAGVDFPPPDLYIHEEIARWSGWSLSAPRVGYRLGTTGLDDANDLPEQANGNPACDLPNASEANTVTPQLSATFTVPGGTLPKLRFGNQYQMRARGADLAGNGPPPTTTDSTYATQVFTHYRFQPVPPPVVVPTDVLTPGQGVMLAALLNYSDGSSVQGVGRWLFPPRGSQLLAEEHGMLDGFVLGDEVGLGGPSGAAATWTYLAQADAGTLLNTTDGTPGSAPLAVLDPSTATPGATFGGSPYFPTDLTNIYGEEYLPAPATAWIPDPLSGGISLSGMPGGVAGEPTLVAWNNGPWPILNPILIVLNAGSSPGTSFLTTQGEQPQAVFASVPPAGVYNVHIASSVSDWGGFAEQSGADLMGVWQWITAGQSADQRQASRSDALKGMWWLLSPYHTLRMVHAVRLPIGPPEFHSPVVLTRSLGSTRANIVDKNFQIDAVLPGSASYGASTSSVDFQATWSDPLDDPSDPTNAPDRDETTTTADPFKLSVSDPNPPAAVDDPGTVLPALTPFELLSSPGATHDIGDTKYHSITYTPTATSRFAEFFRSYPAQEIAIPSGASSPITTSLVGVSVAGSTYGVDPFSVRVEDVNGNDVPATDYSVDGAIGAGTITLTAAGVSAYEGQTLEVSWIPTITLPGVSTTLPILASARPKPPKILRVVPSWQITPPAGPIVEGSGAPGGSAAVTYQRAGNFLRVYLDRPWWTSGANELLGVVMPPPKYQSSTPPPDPAIRLITLAGFDPISLANKNLDHRSAPEIIVPNTTLPASIAGRSGYPFGNFAELTLQEDPSNLKYEIYPYAVSFDYNTNQWYADIEIGWYGTPPPPGYFVRLGLTRFQPYAEPGLELSTVALATFAQPVSNRSVTVTQDFNSELVNVTVVGPAYEGFRPAPAIPTPNPNPDDVLLDLDNSYSPGIYSRQGDPLPMQTSSMVVDFQYQPAGSPLPAGLSWQPCSGPPPGGTGIPPVLLTPHFDNGVVTWTGTAQIPTQLAGQSGSAVRLRISELDYYQSMQYSQTPEPPAQVDTTVRRPFVCHIPISTLPQP